MPELPDVEVYRRYIDSTSMQQRIDNVHVESPSILHETTPQALGRVMNNEVFHTTSRHGKYLFVELSNEQWLFMHFGMSGKLKYFKGQSHTPDYTRLLISFVDDYHLAYIAPRKLGRIGLTDSPKQWVENNKLGPDVLEISEDDFLNLASQRRGSVKSWLMDQEALAGIGNIYSDEILFKSHLHPKRTVNSLTESELKQLHKNISKVLNTAIDADADPGKLPSSYLLPHRDKGGRCPGCKGELALIKVGGRTAWYCPSCQVNS